MMFRAVVFTFMPTAIELGLVCTLLARRFRPAVALLVLATFVAYVTWTTVMTQVNFLPLKGPAGDVHSMGQTGGVAQGLDSLGTSQSS